MTERKRLFNLPWHTLGIIFTLAWPTMIEQLLHTAVQYIDTAMVGTLGTEATAAVGSTTTVSWLIGSTVSAIGVGFLSYISQAMGRGDNSAAKRASAQSILAVLVIGSVFTALTLSLSGVVPRLMMVEESIRPIAVKYFFIIYLPMLPRTASMIFGTVLRAAGDTKTPLRVGITVNAVNVLLNFALIYPTREITLFSRSVKILGAGLGVIGAAIATAIAFTVGGILITAALLCHKEVSPIGESWRPDGRILASCLKVALPNGLQRFGTSFGYVVFAAMVNSIGGAATAAHTIANTVESAFYIPGYGMQSAAATLAGRAVGKESEEDLTDLSRMIIFVEVVLMIISGGILFATAPFMMRIFSSDAAVVALGALVLRMVAVSEPFYGISIIIEGMMQGMGKTVMPFITNIFGMWLVRIVGTYITVVVLGGGLAAAWGCMILHNLAIFTVFFACYITGKWNPLQKRT